MFINNHNFIETLNDDVSNKQTLVFQSMTDRPYYPKPKYKPYSEIDSNNCYSHFAETATIDTSVLLVKYTHTCDKYEGLAEKRQEGSMHVLSSWRKPNLYGTSPHGVAKQNNNRTGCRKQMKFVLVEVE